MKPLKPLAMKMSLALAVAGVTPAAFAEPSYLLELRNAPARGGSANLETTGWIELDAFSLEAAPLEERRANRHPDTVGGSATVWPRMGDGSVRFLRDTIEIGATFSSGTLLVLDEAGNTTASIELGNAVLSGYTLQANARNSPIPTEQISLSYTRVTIHYND